MRRQIVLIGDSLTQGTGVTGTASTYEQGGKGSWWEIARDALANLATVGPLLSAGMRPTSLGRVGQNKTEWTFSGAFSAVLSTDAFDKVPYGGSGITGFRYGNGSTVIATWTKQKWMPSIVGFAVDFVDYAAGGDFQYRIDGGTWTNITQTLLNDNHLMRFYIASAVTTTVDFRAYNGAAGVGMLVWTIEPYFSTATNGLTIHNLAINGSQLHELTLATSGDRMACFDAIRLGTGSPIAPYPNAGVVNMNINDVVWNSTSLWNTDLTALNSRVGSLGPLGLMNPWECDTGTYDQTVQTNYRAQTKTSAAAFSPAAKVLDFYDLWSGNGWTGNAAAVTAGLLADGIHQSQAGNLDLWPRVYWFIRNQILAIGAVPSSYPVSAKQAAVQYSGKLAAVQYSAGAPVGIG